MDLGLGNLSSFPTDGNLSSVRSDYQRARKEDAQRGMVSKKMSTAHPTSSVIWTYRTTGCDVVSITTTTRAVKNGMMKDIKLPSKQVRRIRPPAKNAPVGAIHIDMDNVWSGPIDKRKLHDILHEEKRVFMNKLIQQRRHQSRSEHAAAILIQKRYRGLLVRKHLSTIHRRLTIHKALRPAVVKAIRAEILDKASTSPVPGPQAVTSWGQHRRLYSQKRYICAQIIQMAYRRLLSRRRLSNLRVQAKRWRYKTAIIRLQCWFRSLAAKERVGALKLFRWKLKVRKAATKIQCLYRRIASRRQMLWRRWRLHWVAARLIQCAYRSMHSKFKVKLMQRIMVQAKLSKGSKGMQRLVRGFICRRRVNRIRLRKIYRLVHEKISQIQKIIRSFLARHRMRRLRRERIVQQNEKEMRAMLEDQVKQDEAEAAEAAALSREMDIFVQAREGRVAAVCDIIKSGEAMVDDVDEEGNTVMMIAAAENHLDIIRRCVMLGGNCNHKNHAGDSVLSLAVKNRNAAVVQYITMPSSFAAAEKHSTEKNTEIIRLKYIDDDVKGALLVEAARGPTPETTLKREGRFNEDGEPVNNDDPENDNRLLSLLAHTSGYDFGLTHPEVDSPQDGWTVLHACAASGHVPTYKLIFKIESGFDPDITDSLGRTPLHLAAANSLDITKLLLGVEHVDTPRPLDEASQDKIMCTDADDKDVLVHAALAGQGDILTFLLGCLSPGRAGDKDAIGWSPADITATLALAESSSFDATLDEPSLAATTPVTTAPNSARESNLAKDRSKRVCLAFLIDTGFDPAWSNDDGVCLAMVAARTGNTEVVELLLERQADFSQTDKQMRNCIVYACRCKQGEMLSTLYTHPNKNSCNIRGDLLSIPDLNGETALHAVARFDTEVTIDLLAREHIEEALTTFDNDGMSPLLRACHGNSQTAIKSLLKLGADATAVDKVNGYNALWLLYHPSEAIRGVRRPIGSQFAHRSEITRSSGQHKARSAQEVKAENEARWRAERDLVLSLLHAGARLFQKPPRPAREIVDHASYDVKNSADMDLSEFEACDIIVSEHGFELLKALPSCLSNEECWRAIISSIRYDDGSGKMLIALMDGGAATHLYLSKDDENESSSPSKKDKASVGKNSMANLHRTRYSGTSLSGWIVMMRRSMLLQVILRKGYDMTGVVDDDGNTLLHLAAEFGNSGTVDVIAGNSNVLLEWENNAGVTAAEHGAKMGDTGALRKLIKYGADPRRALAGTYRAWLLACAWQREKREMNLQTGRIGDDDERYFPMKPHPNYVFWYDTYRKLGETKSVKPPS